MPSYRDTAVVLRTHKLGEADRIVTLLTKTRGRVRAVAKGVRRTSSRIGARLEPGSYVDVQCYEGRNLDTVTQVVSLANYGAMLAPDYGRWTTAQAMVETAERLTAEEGDPAPQHFLLLVGGLRALASAEHDAGLVLDAYLLRSLAVAGWAASFHDCASCGATGPHRDFLVSGGGALCSDCRVAGATRPASGTLPLMGALLAGDWAVADAADARSRRDAAGLTAAYLQWHLERKLRSLRYVERD